MPTTVLPLSEAGLDAASVSLAQAFMQDPLQTYVFPDVNVCNQLSPPHFRAVLDYGLRFGEVYSTENAAGAVVWLPPGHTDVTPEKAGQSSLGQLPELLGEEAATRFFTVMDFLDPFHQEDAPDPHWYTMVIGVAPAFWGQGYGRALMAPVMEKARQQQVPIYLETAEPANIAFYTRLGFRVVRELTEPVSHLPLWTFRKDF